MQYAQYFALLISLALTPSAYAATVTGSVDIRDSNGVSNVSRFHCNDQIYAFATISNIVDEEPHLVKVIWRDPTGVDQETLEDELVADSQGDIIQYVWLKLHRPTGSAFFSIFDDTYGMTEFIGEWSVILRYDGEDIAKSNFTVYC